MGKSDEFINPEGAVAPGYLVNHAARVFNRRVDAELKPHGLSLALIGPLLILSWKGVLLQRDLVSASAIRQPAMVAILDKLERMKLIERETTETDRRASQIRLTSEGKEAAQRGRQALSNVNALGLQGFAPGETALLVGLLQRFILNLEGERDTS
jgi:MarR family transcriptional regulator, transcriptional regulator for hemolysin